MHFASHAAQPGKPRYRCWPGAVKHAAKSPTLRLTSAEMEDDATFAETARQPRQRTAWIEMRFLLEEKGHFEVARKCRFQVTHALRSSQT
jgi:hypothetical protein